jgi:hypothetical protein
MFDSQKLAKAEVSKLVSRHCQSTTCGTLGQLLHTAADVGHSIHAATVPLQSV